MRAELYRRPAEEGEPEQVVAIATWTDGRAEIEPLDPTVAGIEAVVRPTPVAVDDPALRSQGAYGDVVLQPGDLGWFLAAVRSRAEALGLSVRFVPPPTRGGWDPASQYRRFDEQVERLARDRS